MKRYLPIVVILALLVSVVPLTTSSNSVKAAPDLEVVCVPWKGIESLPHPTWDGKEITLKGTVRYPGAVNWEWDFGDGSPPETGTATVGDDYPYPIPAKHTYAGLVGANYVATLTVTAGAEVASDTYLVEICDEARETKAHVAVDEGLWWLYGQQIRYASGGVEFGYWQDSSRVAHTGAAVQSFENNLHKPFGDPIKDPYVDCVRRGLNYLTSQMHKVDPIPADDGDTNGNGFGVACYYDYNHEMYEIGMAMMAIVSSDTPGRVAVAGPDGVIDRTYQDIIQDMCDFCAWAQNDGGHNEGGWRYRNNYGSSDNSCTQWPIMGMEPAEAKWGCTIADFVRPRLEGWLDRTQNANGAFGYGGNSDWLNIAKTAGTGIPGLVFCGVESSDDRIQRAITYIDEQWETANDDNGWPMNFGNGYAMYAVKKCYEEFLPMESTGTHIWWDEYCDYLVPIQQSDGRWKQMTYLAYSDQLTTAWMVMILTKGVYDIPPTAVALANGFNSTEVDKDQIVNFDGSQSRDGTYEIVKYEWDWESDGVYDAEGMTATHSYGAYDTYIATLRVTDNRDVATGGEKEAMTDTDTCTVWVHPPPHAPIADANGPYVGWPGTPVTLDGSGSWDPNPEDTIVVYAWDLDNDGVFETTTSEATAEHTWDAEGTYPIALKVKDDSEFELWCEEPSRTLVEIGNHDPVADADGPYEACMGQEITLDGSGSYDPDEPVGDSIVSYEWDLDNDGDYDDGVGVNPVFQRDIIDTYTVRLKVTDTLGATGTDWTTVTVVENAPPVADINGPYTGNEGSAAILDGSASFDPNNDIISYEWDLDGDGEFDDASGELVEYTWGDDYAGDICLKVTDSFGVMDTDCTTVNVLNVDPAATATNTGPVDEGSPVDIDVLIMDPGSDDLTYTIDYGDGTPTETRTSLNNPPDPDPYPSPEINPRSVSDMFTYTYGDNGVYTVTLTVEDDDGGSTTVTTLVTVNNVDPSASIDSVDQPTPYIILPYEELSFGGSFTDPGWLDTHTATWDFGDGTSVAGTLSEENEQPDATGTTTATHAYSAAGTYTVTLTVTDDDGGVGTATTTVTVMTAEEAKHVIMDYIQSLPDEAFDGQADQRKNALMNKFEAVDHMLDVDNYHGAIQKLQHDIRAKADGNVDGKSNDDWIIDMQAQQDICTMIDALVAYLETLL